jgi:hypothetical protein
LQAVLDPSTRRVTEKCERFLRTARTALDNGDPESAASRAYYALYHMRCCCYAGLEASSETGGIMSNSIGSFSKSFVSLISGLVGQTETIGEM